MSDVYEGSYGGSYGSSSGGGGAISFSGPIRYTRSLASKDPRDWATNQGAQLLLRHYGGQPDGVNLYIMEDGTITEIDPSDWTLVDEVYWGGHVNEVTEARALFLIEEGYGEWLDFTGVGYIDFYTDTYYED